MDLAALGLVGRCKDVPRPGDPTARPFTVWKPCCCKLARSVSVRLPMDDQVRRRAYELWEADGRPHGQDQQYWFKALADLAAAAAATIKPPSKRAPRAKKAA